MNIKLLFSELSTDWTQDKDLQDLIEKHQHDINTCLSTEIETFKGILRIFPEPKHIFRCFDMFDKKELKVVIIGQDVYINEGEGMGLCFSVPSIHKKTPPSLRNIFKELEMEYNKKRVETDLTDWAKQGVLLLNRSLTVREGASMSHMKIWKDFTLDIIHYLNREFVNIVYILWGQPAQSLEPYIDSKQNLILKHSHPSPLSRKPFIGNNHFKLCNEYLENNSKQPIQWFHDETGKTF